MFAIEYQMAELGVLYFMVRPEGLEPPAYWFEASRSIQLSYGRAPIRFYREQTTSKYRPSGLGISSSM